ncbi:MAG: FUSC family protein [Cyanobacteriota bacterium]|nr:FUSC family protein [Cyanobacteriota bacterium]
MTTPAALRYPLVVGLGAALVWSIAHALGFGSGAAYGVVIGAVATPPDLRRLPPPLLVVVPVLSGVALGLGTLLKPLLEAPVVWAFAIVTLCAQLIAQLLPDRLAPLRTLLPALAILPLLASNGTWLSAWHELLAIMLGLVVAVALAGAFRLPADAPAREGPEPAALPVRPLGRRLGDPYFWRKVIASTLALAVGQGLGAVNPKYVYFGVVILLNESLGATMARVRDRMVGVSLGILMPWLVFNLFGVSSVSLALVMGGTAALLPALGLGAHLRTALISSGVTFAGYQALTDWYIPTRWIDYLMGCGLALLVCVCVQPTSALRRFQELAAAPAGQLAMGELMALVPSAREEAIWLGQGQRFDALLAAARATSAGGATAGGAAEGGAAKGSTGRAPGEDRGGR